MSEIPVEQQTIDGIDSGVAVIGDGQPVVLLHGWGASLDTMWPVAKRLSDAGFAAHTLDFPGFGKSDLPPTSWTVPDFARWVVHYLDQANLDRVHLIGHSFGGRVSLVLGADYPERIGRIVLSNSAGVRLPPPLRAQVALAGYRAVMGFLSLPGLKALKPTVEKRVQGFRRMLASEDYLNAGPLQETFKLVVSQDLLPFAQRIQAPTLLFWGDQDTDTPLVAGRRLEQTIPDASLILFEGAGHYAYLDNLTQFIRVTVHFFNDGKA
ncbi:MAG: alpha/beta hydrolase [Chloroflexi bacterium]|nr:alpha/beta hydrolase [Chloroflexota bacterium]